ncbi:serum amyloid A-4 protein-like [Manis javanica]|uniref:serum amyloid A-4 protein-like n=1 Tax=Manis javanica TaxID=9974 RepID=UPI003C6DA9E0
MKIFTGVIFCSLVLGVSSESWYSFFKEAVQGAWDLSRAYWDQQVANHQHSDQYFYARGNYDASKRGPGGIWAAKVISLARDSLQGLFNRYYFGSSSRGLEDLQAKRKAEEWGRSGRDPNHFRPSDLPKEY